MYLIDTNVWLERLLSQAKAEEVGLFLAHIPSDELLITDFAFHSIGVVLCKLDKGKALQQFVNDAFIDGAVAVLALQPEEMGRLLNVMDAFHLDFDDAYQYVASEKYDAIIVSFDSDFDRTELGRSTPSELLSTTS